MTIRTGQIRGFGIAALLAFVAAGDAFAAQRTFVSTSGSDANACSLAAPCRGFAQAITVTDPGGELVVLDSGGYGSVTVNKNVTILSPAGVYAGISVFAAQDGVTVTAPATRVVLRGLTINGQGGNNGVRVQAGEVHIENVVVSNMGAAGILVEGGSTVRISGTVSRSNVDGLRVAPGAGAVSVVVRDSEFGNNSVAGIGVSPSAGGSGALVTVERSSVTKNGAGVAVAPGGSASATVVLTQSVASENAGAGVSSSGSTSTVFVRESAVTRNGTGLLQAASGILNACGSNLLVANATAQSGTINVNAAACLDQVAGGTVTSVATGAGLTGGPITTSGTVSVANGGITAAMLAGNGCASGQLLKWNGSAWACANDVDTNSGGTVTSVTAGAGLTGGTITASGTIAVDPASATLTGSFFRQGGNTFGATAQLGTGDNNALEISVNNTRAMRYEPNGTSPNIVGGHPNNGVGASYYGQTVGGGGAAGTNCYDPPTGLSNRSCGNQATHSYATVGGGYSNAGSGSYATIGGGYENTASWSYATIGGGYENTASGIYATVGGGGRNIASGVLTSVGGGYLNAASGDYATVAGGYQSTASDAYATVGGGVSNTASGISTTVGGGDDNMASGDAATVGGGAGNTASGSYATVGGGYLNVASGSFSFAAGRQAKTQTSGAVIHSGTFAFADSSAYDFYTTAANQFAVRSVGGARFVLGIDGAGNPTWTCSVASGGSWSCSSDRNLKQNLRQLDGVAVLDRLARMPVYAWNPKGENASVLHYGPTAQDFHAAFGLGESELAIGQQDADGVALAAIQGLNTKVEALAAALAERDARIDAQRKDIAELKARLARLATPVAVATSR